MATHGRDDRISQRGRSLAAGWLLLTLSAGLGTGAGVALAGDCNGNLVDDDMEIQGGQAADCNANGIPDDCELTPDAVVTLHFLFLGGRAHPLAVPGEETTRGVPLEGCARLGG